jgi:hypothetical protein
MKKMITILCGAALLSITGFAQNGYHNRRNQSSNYSSYSQQRNSPYQYNRNEQNYQVRSDEDGRFRQRSDDPIYSDRRNDYRSGNSGYYGGYAIEGGGRFSNRDFHREGYGHDHYREHRDLDYRR